MKKLRKLLCILLIACLTPVCSGVLFADTDIPYNDSAAENGEVQDTDIACPEDAEGEPEAGPEAAAVSETQEETYDGEETKEDSEMSGKGEENDRPPEETGGPEEDLPAAESTGLPEETFSAGTDAENEGMTEAEKPDEPAEDEGENPEAETEKILSLKEKETDERAGLKAAGDPAETFTVRFNANGGSGTMPALSGLLSGTSERIPVNAFTNSGSAGRYVASWNTRADGAGSSYLPNSALSAVVADMKASGKTSVTLYAQWTQSVTVNVQIQETHPSETTFGIQTGTLYRRYNQGKLIQKSTDGGTTWTATIAAVSTEDAYCRLPRVYAQAGMSISRPGYSNKNVTAYNTAADGSGVFLRANQTAEGQNNPVNTTTLNGGTPITEAGHTVTIYVYWEPDTYSLTVHNNASSIGRGSEEAEVVYPDLQYGTMYYLTNSTYGPENNTGYNWLLPSPRFAFEGYLFYGWNTKADGSGDWYSGFFPGFSNLASGNGGSADLYALWKEAEGIAEPSTLLSNGAVITKGYHDFSDVNLMIPKYYNGEGKQTDPANIEFGVNGGSGQLFWNPVYVEAQSSEEDGEEPEEEPESGISAMHLTIGLNKGTRQIYDLGETSAYVLLKNRAFDMEGNRYDVKITFSGITAADYSGKYETGNLFIVRSSGSCNLYSETALASSYDVTIEILRPKDSAEAPGQPVTDKTTVLYFADLDIPANAASRQFLGLPSDDHNTYAYYDPASGEIYWGTEHIEVSPEDGSRICIADNNLIHAYVKDGRTQLTGTYYTGVQSERAGLVDTEGNGLGLPIEMTSAAVVFPSDRIRFRFGATRASTALFMDDIFVSIVSNVRDCNDFNTILENGTGGTIDHGGEGAVRFARGAAPEYSVSALEGYYIKDIWIDGICITENPDAAEAAGLVRESTGPYLTKAVYTFSNVQEDHTIDVSFKRMFVPVDLLLHKACENGELPADRSVLKDAEFRIDFYRGLYTGASAAEDSGSPERSWVFRTDENGELRMKDAALQVSGDELFYDQNGEVCLPEGTLVIRETKAPPGFERNDRAFVTTVSFDNDGNAVVADHDENGGIEKEDRFGPGEVADPDRVIKETLSLSNSVTIQKTIFRQDYLEEHGKPNFMFEITGEDLTGKEHTFCRMISFEEITEGNGTITKSVTVSGVPSGRYAVRELDSFRFSLTDIFSDRFSVITEPSGPEKDSITEIKGYAYGSLLGNADVLVGFTNRKVKWDEYSDTSSVTNHIG